MKEVVTINGRQEILVRAEDMPDEDRRIKEIIEDFGKISIDRVKMFDVTKLEPYTKVKRKKEHKKPFIDGWNLILSNCTVKTGGLTALSQSHIVKLAVFSKKTWRISKDLSQKVKRSRQSTVR